MQTEKLPSLKETFQWNDFLLLSIPDSTRLLMFLINTKTRTAYVVQEPCVIHPNDVDDDDVAVEPQIYSKSSFPICIPESKVIQTFTPFCVCTHCCQSHSNTILCLAGKYFPNQMQNKSTRERLNFAYQCLPEILGLFAKQMQVDTLLLCDQEEMFQGSSAIAGWDKQTLREKLGVQVVHVGAMSACQYIHS
jgi:hypothetical protein